MRRWWGHRQRCFVRVENGLVQARPISGTMPRGTDSLTDYHNMMRLLNSEKEKSELDMLIDLARNDRQPRVRARGDGE